MSQRFPWYDSFWLSQYLAAQAYLREHRPDTLGDFHAALAPFRTRNDFQVQRLRRVFDERVVSEIKELAGALPLEELELHEMAGFGRFVVHDQQALAHLQVSTVPLVSELAGEALEPHYSFLSMYTKLGRCPVHMDAPSAKWTLDICIDQSEPWPIYLSQTVPWPESFAYGGDDWSDRVKADPAHVFTPYSLVPGDALFFAGASQWHYRDPLPRAGRPSFATMLFLHFIPQGTGELVDPANWCRIFDVPELARIVDAHQRDPSLTRIREDAP